ncbi:MAG: orotidine 5'-phosphate decarboxylase, partial [Chloroflexota bacterium]|nr:orotidine 5'-phosphate decarboxylase [Chloroflexota bacterium]
MGAFLRKLAACVQANESLLCIGLDPDLDLLPVDCTRDAAGVVAFNQSVIEATSDLVCAYKPNLAFYEAMGSAGLRALEHTLALIPEHIPTIGDAKRGDVPNTARAYAHA